MKKKWTLALAVMMALLLSMFLVACDSSAGGGSKSGSTLTFGKKYISTSDLTMAEQDQTYFIFNRDGTGNYHFFFENISSSSNKVRDYTVTFRYKVVEDTVVMFYDSVSYAARHNQGDEVKTTWTSMYAFTSDFLALEDVKYVCESFLPNIPNFGK